MRISFRRLASRDLPQLHDWLNDPGVVEWWEGEDVSWKAVQRNYGSGNADATEQWIASLDGKDLGWLECYPAEDELDETELWFPLGVHPKTAGIDFLIGDPSQRGKGIGSAMIRAFLLDVVFNLHPEWPQACSGPFDANVASWRALEKAGFRFKAMIDDDEGPCRLMSIDRSEAMQLKR